jgi:hypothetical protein
MWRVGATSFFPPAPVILRQRSPRRKPRTPNEGSLHSSARELGRAWLQPCRHDSDFDSGPAGTTTVIFAKAGEARIVLEFIFPTPIILRQRSPWQSQGLPTKDLCTPAARELGRAWLQPCRHDSDFDSGPAGTRLHRTLQGPQPHSPSEKTSKGWPMNRALCERYRLKFRNSKLHRPFKSGRCNVVEAVVTHSCKKRKDGATSLLTSREQMGQLSNTR